MRWPLTCVALALLLAACGAEAPPRPPQDAETPPRTGIGVSGSAELGVSGRS